MAWVRISDDFYDHPKMAGLSPMALGYWITTLAWCNRNLTDGAIPRPVASRLVDFQGVAVADSDVDVDAGHAEGYTWLTCVNELLDAGVLEETDRGFSVVDYLDYQPSAERVRAERERTAARQREWRERNKGSNGVSHSGVTVAPTPTPTPTPKTTTPAAGAAEPDGFAAFWSTYPRKIGKQAAAKAYAKALAATGDPQAILAGAQASARFWEAEKTASKFIPHPVTWLNQGRWADEVASTETPREPAPVRRSAAQCDDPEPHPKHEWEWKTNRHICWGV